MLELYCIGYVWLVLLLLLNLEKVNSFLLKNLYVCMYINVAIRICIGDSPKANKYIIKIIIVINLRWSKFKIYNVNVINLFI